eukprot:TRINITY_DN288_c1_g1_i4.p1 TRINITY_DN288_c1_g1~~TRINITY_DN288_c1_g1_i4.p1  ORF type:complete len:230 (-),score=51.22 TRINITY_DN288_c1_g1_i4:40-729(-)
MVVAWSMAQIKSDGLECGWYFASFLLDSSIAVITAYAMSKGVEKLAFRYNWIYLKESGNYGSPPSFKIWIIQIGVWGIIVIISRLFDAILVLLMSNPISKFVYFVSLPFEGHPDLFLVSVMVVCPVFLNILQMWVQDAFLKAKTRRSLGRHNLLPDEEISYVSVVFRNEGRRHGHRRDLEMHTMSSTEPQPQPQPQSQSQSTPISVQRVSHDLDEINDARPMVIKAEKE